MSNAQWTKWSDGRPTVGRRTGHKNPVITLPMEVRFRSPSAREELITENRAF